MPASAIIGLADRDAALFACVIHKFGASYSGGEGSGGQWLNIRGFIAIRVLAARNRVVMKASFVLLSPDSARDTNEVTTHCKWNRWKREWYETQVTA